MVTRVRSGSPNFAGWAAAAVGGLSSQKPRQGVPPESWWAGSVTWCHGALARPMALADDVS